MSIGARVSSKAPRILLILPAYNEAARIGRTMDSIAEYSGTSDAIQSVLLADDGSSDETVGIARDRAEQRGVPLEVLELPHTGKAGTVRAAMLSVAGRSNVDYVMMLDADDELAIDQLDGIDWSANPMTIYIGRRVLTVGHRRGIRPTPVRRAMSATMRLASKALLGISFPDTQCGFKLFPAGVVSDLFSQQRSRGWTFDAELLFIAHSVSGMPVVEVPLVWAPRGVSRVRPWSAAISGVAMLGVFVRRVRGSYKPIGYALATSNDSRSAVPLPAEPNW